MKEKTQPLAEVFGHLIVDNTDKGNRYRTRRLCPFNNKVPNCTKDKAINPLGVCSIYYEHHPVITCPIRFRENWFIADDAASFFFGEGAKWSSLTGVKLNDANGKTAGNIDVVLVAFDNNGKVYNFGVLVVQAVYVSGNVRDPFEYYMKDPENRATMDWSQEANYPRPDYLSSRKRLSPQLLFKGGILNNWKKKTAVATTNDFINTLPDLTLVNKEDADIAWLVYNLKHSKSNDARNALFLERIIYTKRLDDAIIGDNKNCETVDMFLHRLENELDEVVV